MNNPDRWLSRGDMNDPAAFIFDPFFYSFNFKEILIDTQSNIPYN